MTSEASTKKDGIMVKKRDPKEILNDDDCEDVMTDIHRKLSHVVSKQDKLNEAVQNVGDFLEKAPNIMYTKNRGKARDLQQHLLRCSESQESYIRGLLDKIRRVQEYTHMRDMQKVGSNRSHLMKLLNTHAHCLPLWVNSVKEGFPQQGVGAVPVPDTKPLELGDAVAAYYQDNWIMAEVIAIQGGGKYELRDVDTCEQETKLTLGRKRLIPLPKYRADPARDRHALFPQEAIVLALYPQTTCFYKGVVVRVPPTATDDYLVSFEDATFSTGYSPPSSVPQRYIVTYKEIKSKKKAVSEDD